MLTNAEARLLRFLQASKATWTPATVIFNTEDLLPGDEKALPGLVSRAFVIEHVSQKAYRVSEEGISALGRTRGNVE